MNLRHVTNFDYVLFLAVIGLSVIGILFIYSSGVNSDGISVSHEYIKQLIWVVSGLILLFAVAVYDYTKIADRTLLIYIITMLLLEKVLKEPGVGLELETSVYKSPSLQKLFIFYFSHGICQDLRMSRNFADL